MLKVGSQHIDQAGLEFSAHITGKARVVAEARMWAFLCSLWNRVGLAPLRAPTLDYAIQFQGSQTYGPWVSQNSLMWATRWTLLATPRDHSSEMACTEMLEISPESPPLAERLHSLLGKSFKESAGPLRGNQLWAASGLLPAPSSTHTLTPVAASSRKLSF